MTAPRIEIHAWCDSNTRFPQADADETAKAASENAASADTVSQDSEAPKKRGWWSRAFQG